MTESNIKITIRRDDGSVEGEAIFSNGKWHYFKLVGKGRRVKRIPADLPPRLRKQARI